MLLFLLNISKLEKACLIFNTQKEDGFVACVHDSAKNSEGGYWVDLFLQVCERADDFYFTQNMMTVCKEYISKQLPEEFEVTRIDQADLLNRSAQFFKENEMDLQFAMGIDNLVIRQDQSKGIVKAFLNIEK